MISSTFVNGVREIREYEERVSKYSNFFNENNIFIKNAIEEIKGNF